MAIVMQADGLQAREARHGEGEAARQRDADEGGGERQSGAGQDAPRVGPPLKGADNEEIPDPYDDGVETVDEHSDGCGAQHDPLLYHAGPPEWHTDRRVGKGWVDLQLNDRIALVTGSSRGLGFASARSLVAEGARVAICARGAERLSEAAEELRQLGAARGDDERVLAIEADLATDAGIAAVVDRTVETFGGLDILVNNVGRAGGGGIAEATDDEWHAALDQTLWPAIRASRRAVPHLRARQGGIIIMIASIWGRESGGRMTYNAVKAAEISLAKSMALELAPDQIRVVSVCPGSISFPGGSWYRRQQEDPDGMAAFVRAQLPFGRFGRAEEVGDVVAFLASDRASWVSGAAITVDGCQSRSLI